MRSFILGVCLLATVNGIANASLIGDSVNASVSYTTRFFAVSPASAVVTDPGVEFTFGFTDVDVFADRISVINTFPVGFDWADGATFTLSDLDWVGTPGIVTGASLDNLVDVTGLTDDDLSYTADSVTIALGPSNFLSSRSRFDIVLETSHVPEPSTYVMWAAMGLVGTGLYWKRRKE